MSKFDGKEIARATLLSVLHSVNMGQFGPKLNSTSNGLQKGVKMVLDGNFVVLELTAKNGALKETVLVPITYFSDITPA